MFKMLESAAVPLVAVLSMAAGSASAQSTYLLEDLGTLGGSTSTGRAINEAGQVTGSSYKTVPLDEYAFVWDEATGMKDPCVEDPGCVFIHDTVGLDINELGQVTGFAHLSSTVKHAFLWDGTAMIDLDTLGSDNSTGVAINDSGQVTGEVRTALSGTRFHPFIWNGTAMVDLGNLCTTGLTCYESGGGRDINEAGHVAGFTALSESPYQRAFLWDGTAMTALPLGDLTGYQGSVGNAINESDQVAGHAYTTGGYSRAVRWDPSTGIVELAIPPGINVTCDGLAINASGAVLGWCHGIYPDYSDYFDLPYLWDESGITGLGALETCDSAPCALNDREQVIGAFPFDWWVNHAALWEDGELYDLNELIDPTSQLQTCDPSWTPSSGGPAPQPCIHLTAAYAINNGGQIVAQGTDFGTPPPYETHAYRLTPLNPDDEPPLVSALFADTNPVRIGVSTTLTATVDDSDTGESAIASAEYRLDPAGAYVSMSASDSDFDEVTEVVTADLPGFAEAGVYEICVRGTDEPGNTSDPATDADNACALVVAYDPSGGFVTGGGWFYSDVGACHYSPVCTEAEGKATFGFVSRYKRGATIPTGNTEFQFKAGGLSFHSETYDWLVVNKNGTNAQYKGSGTINGDLGPSGEAYKFMLFATDLDSTGIDTFRIKIWYEETGDEKVVYDNGSDQEIGGGNIVVHTK